MRTMLIQELRFIFPALPLLTMLAAVSLAGLLPGESSQLVYPLDLLADRQEGTAKKTDEAERSTGEPKSSSHPAFSLLAR